MRLEFHLILWVTAGIAGMLILSSGTLPSAKTSLPFDGNLNEQIATSPEGFEQTGIRRLTYPELSFADYDDSVRGLFPRVESVSITTPTPREENLATALPILKGMLSDGVIRKAVFAADPSASQYVVRGVGEQITDYRILEIGEDFVVAAAPSGEVISFKLRGTGEAP